jgi:hypothetical protein
MVDYQEGQEMEPIQPPIPWVTDVNQPGREVDHSPPSSEEVKNGGAIPPLPYTS